MSATYARVTPSLPCGNPNASRTNERLVQLTRTDGHVDNPALERSMYHLRSNGSATGLPKDFYLQMNLGMSYHGVRSGRNRKRATQIESRALSTPRITPKSKPKKEGLSILPML